MIKQPSYILTNPNTGRHLYGRGWLGLIPLVGAFVGIGLITLGIVRYKDKKLIVIGCAAILFTVIIYGSLYYTAEYSDLGRSQKADITQYYLNSLVKDIEFYKLQKGQYPDSLQQIKETSKSACIDDPLSQKGWFGKEKIFNYKKFNNGYIVFSCGKDMIDNTKDDIYPTVDSSHTGLLRVTQNVNTNR